MIIHSLKSCFLECHFPLPLISDNLIQGRSWSRIRTLELTNQVLYYWNKIFIMYGNIIQLSIVNDH